MQPLPIMGTIHLSQDNTLRARHTQGDGTLQLVGELPASLDLSQSTPSFCYAVG